MSAFPSLRNVLFRASGHLLAFAIVASLAGGAASVGLIATINRALSTPADQLAALGLRFAALAAAVLLCRTAALMLFVRLNQTVLASLRGHIAGRLLASPYAELERVGPGRGLALLGEDTNQVATLLVALPFVVMNGTIVLGCLAYLAYLSWQVFLFALVAVLTGSICYRLSRKRSQRYLRDAGKWHDVLIERFGAIFAGAKELKLHRQRREAFASGPLAEAIDAVRTNRTQGLSLLYLSLTIGSTLFFAVIGIILFVVQRPLGADAAVASGYTLVFLYMMAPLEGLLNSLPQLNLARIAYQRIADTTGPLAVEPSLPDAAGERQPFVELELRGVTHRYFRDGEDGAFTLGPIDLSLRAGEVVFLVGGNGSGKTTLAKLLVGLYAPERGSVLLNGEPIADAADHERHRQQCTAVFSDFHLFDSLLGAAAGEGGDGKNAAGCTALDARANELLARLQLQHKVTVRDGAFSTRALSQGQRKRLALVAACLEDRPVIVLDEWAADQDPAFKAVFYREIVPALRAQGKAVLVISHDDRYFDAGDRIVRLEQGRIREQGSEDQREYQREYQPAAEPAGMAIATERQRAA
ncbi:cyclic peptide export ABC transporter [Cupriavidus gilardii]|uniref:Cyclic peptide export ABC transporter n=1 Tax=Cupriavidus gilardii TaxID=82541 RepID=A0ABY4VIX2_9BURK|nr:cyclic peptide export ABC transporter [Cupriavidus gilardii]USE77185.1 cyclic peptide export ABC transporter [Cupriavidus gilardii]